MQLYGILYKLHIFSIFGCVGKLVPFSQQCTAKVDTPSFFAASACVKPTFFLAAAKVSFTGLLTVSPPYFSTLSLFMFL